MSKVDNRIWSGVDMLLDDYVNVEAVERVLVAYTPESRESAGWIATALKMRRISPILFPMRPMKDDTFVERLETVLPKPESLSGKFAVLTVERDTMSHGNLLRSALSRYDQSRVQATRLINASQEFFIHSMNRASAELSALNTTLLHRFMPARELKIKTAGGSDLRVTIDSSRFRWISNRGSARPGGFVLLPAGEVATHPASVDGVLVADGAFNANAYTNVDARLGNHPVKIRIKDSKAVDFECADPQVSRLMEECLSRPFAKNVGELGFGTNGGAGEFIPMNSHINERRPGVHLGFGQHNQSIHAVNYTCDIHLDMIAVGGLVWVDGDPEPVDLQKVMPSSAPHPTMVLEEDIDGDCCGMWIDGELRSVCEIPLAPAERSRAEVGG